MDYGLPGTSRDRARSCCVVGKFVRAGEAEVDVVNGRVGRGDNIVVVESDRTHVE